jgi:hypothetical protein
LPLTPNQHDLIKWMIKNKKRITIVLEILTSHLYHDDSSHLLMAHEKNNKFYKQKPTTIIGT